MFPVQLLNTTTEYMFFLNTFFYCDLYTEVSNNMFVQLLNTFLFTVIFTEVSNNTVQLLNTFLFTVIFIQR